MPPTINRATLIKETLNLQQDLLNGRVAHPLLPQLEGAPS